MINIPVICLILNLYMLYLNYQKGCITESIGTIILKSDTAYEYSPSDQSPSETEEATSAEGRTETTVIPMEYRSALIKGESYSSIMHMSKTGIYNQLTSDYGEQFSAEAAQYAVDNLDADWNANALAKAKEYSDTMHTSKADIYDQLISEYGEQFTKEEAQYAVDHVEANWKANALEKAKDYQTTMSISPDAIRDQLTSEYGEKFTQEEADCAVSNLN